MASTFEVEEESAGATNGGVMDAMRQQGTAVRNMGATMVHHGAERFKKHENITLKGFEDDDDSFKSRYIFNELEKHVQERELAMQQRHPALHACSQWNILCEKFFLYIFHFGYGEWHIARPCTMSLDSLLLVVTQRAILRKYLVGTCVHGCGCESK